MADEGFTGKGFLWRWGLCLILVLATFNPSGFSYYAWVFGGEGGLALKALTDIVLLIAYMFIVHVTWRVLGTRRGGSLRCLVHGCDLGAGGLRPAVP